MNLNRALARALLVCSLALVGCNPNSGSDAGTGGGSSQTGGGSTQTGGGSAQTGGGSAQTGGGSAQTGGGSAQTGGGSAQTGGGTGGGATTGGGTGGGTAVMCGDGTKAATEACDDGDTMSGDGCSAGCEVEAGFTCSGSPSACVTTCGDGVVAGLEACDDRGTTAADGCSATCTVETGFTCTGSPSTCVAVCGDGAVMGAETCDDTNTMAGDGCSATCAAEAGYTCTGAPSACVTTCGDGVRAGAEACDDLDTTSGDGCSAMCTIEPGFTCVGATLSTCTGICGDGVLVSTETCDDGNTAAGDGCSGMCATEMGFACTGAPSTCAAVCGDGLVVGMETCDDGNTVTETECAYNTPTCTRCDATCATTLNLTGGRCGDGVVTVANETCDDGYAFPGDGCSATCQAEPGASCTGTPSRCGQRVTLMTGWPINDNATVTIPFDFTLDCELGTLSFTETWSTPHTYVGDLVTTVQMPDAGAFVSFSTASNDGRNLAGTYTFGSDGGVWPPAGTAPAIDAGTYFVNFSSLFGLRTPGQWAVSVRDSATGDTGVLGAVSLELWCATNTGGMMTASARSCAEILALAPASPSGQYDIDPDGAGPLAPSNVYCDMVTAGGGWTMLIATNSLGPSALVASATVSPSSGRFVFTPSARALAGLSTQVHVRTAGQADTRSMTSVANTQPIINLRAGVVLNADTPIRNPTDPVSALWTGPMAGDASRLWYSCGPAPYGASPSYPAIYWACNNSVGMHVLGATSTWVNNTPNENIEVYVR